MTQSTLFDRLESVRPIADAEVRSYLPELKAKPRDPLTAETLSEFCKLYEAKHGDQDHLQGAEPLDGITDGITSGADGAGLPRLQEAMRGIEAHGPRAPIRRRQSDIKESVGGE